MLSCVCFHPRFCTEDLGNFSHAVLPPRKKNSQQAGSAYDAMLYQEAGRITGRSKCWGTFKTTKVYCPPSRKANFVRMQRKCEEAMRASMAGRKLGKETLLGQK